nr:uncharacterized protein LOC124817832 [Hydra vulgaris]
MPGIFFRSGWVQKIVHFKLDSGVCIMCADVRPSYRTTDKCHKPWVALKSDGTVLAGHCNCMAGLGETCSHVGAVLYKIEAAVRIGLTSSTPTELPCMWNQLFVRNITGCLVSKINIFSDDAKQKLIKVSSETVYNNVSTTYDSKMNFLEEVNSVQPKSVGLSLFGQFSKKFFCKVKKLQILPPSLRHLYGADTSLLLDENHELLVSQLALSDADVVYIEEATRTQHYSLSWLCQRAGRITGSVIAEVYHASFDSSNVNLVRKICQINKSVIKAQALMWGKNHEKDAIEFYKNICSGNSCREKALNDSIPIHDDFHVESIGLSVFKNKPWYGASPDGVVFCSCCGYGVLEVKCPYALRDKSLQQEIESGMFYVGKEQDGYFLRKSHNYYFQVQHEIMCTEALFCHFVVWTPSECVIVNIEKDDFFLYNMYERCDLFWKKFVLPELITRNLEGSTSSSCENSNPEEIYPQEKFIYCIKNCEFPGEVDNMVGCDRCDNWYHPICIGLKRLPKDKTWYCKQCAILNKKKQ